MNPGSGLLARQFAGVLVLAQAGLLALALGGLQRSDYQIALFCALGFFAVAIVRASLTRWGEGRDTNRALQTIAARRKALIDHVAAQGMIGAKADGNSASTGAIAALGTEKLDALVPDMVHFKHARVSMLVVPLAILIAVTSFSWVAALILLFAAPLIPLFMALIGTAARDTSAQHLQDVNAMHNLFLDRLRALVDIRLLGAVDAATDQFTDAATTVYQQAMKVLRIAFLSSAVLELFSALGVALVAIYVGFSLLGLLDFGTTAGPLTLTSGLFILILAPEFFAPLRAFSAAWHDHASATAIEAEYETLMQIKGNKLVGSGASAEALPGEAIIELQNVQCRNIVYPRNLSVQAGQSVALMGPSGAGKSTLLGMIAGLLRPDSGTILVAGQPLDDSTADGWRARVSWLSQSPHFVAGSIRANVAMGRDVANLPPIEAALAQAAAGAVVQRAPDGLDTIVGETGLGLSGGEARRLALARALYQAGDVILADEPTAHLDAETAQVVGACLLAQAQQGATLIVATHDEALASQFDVIIRLGEQ